MNHVIRKATLFTIGALMVAGAAIAGAPSSATSTLPAGLGLVGTDGTGGPGPSNVDPRGNVTFTIRDAVPNPIPNSLVTINFSACPQIKLCSDRKRSDNVVDCALNTVSGVTNALGQITFSIVGTVEQIGYALNENFPEPDPTPGLYTGCATVRVASPGFAVAIFPNLIAAAYDHETTNPGVGAGDLALVKADILSGNYRERSDYDPIGGGAGFLNAGDLANFIAVGAGGGSAVSCVITQSGTPCP